MKMICNELPERRSVWIPAIYWARRSVRGAVAVAAVGRLLCAAGLALLTVLPTAQAQGAGNYPSRPIRFVVPYSAGGPLDFIGRTLARRLAPLLGQSVFLDNRAGAAGAVGSSYVARSLPDGYTVLLDGSSHITLPITMKNPGFDPVKDFKPITLAVDSVGFVLVASSKSRVDSVASLIAAEKRRPGTLNYASGGNGNAMHFAAEAFNKAAGTHMQHIPYMGVGQALSDLLAGRIDVCFAAPSSVLPHIKSGQLKALGIAADTRWKLLPDVPTIAQAGVAGFKYGAFYGLWFPAGTPDPLVQRMRDEVARVLADADVKDTLATQGFLAIGSTPEAFARTIDKETEFHRALAREIGLAPR